MKNNNGNWLRSSVLAGAMSLATLSAPMVAYAEVAEINRAPDKDPTPTTRFVTDPVELEQLAQRQIESPKAVGDFAGGDPVIIIGGSTLLIVLLAVLIVLLIMD
jgi:hypothetical protein